MIHILLVGAGNIGSRHLQGLAKLSIDANIMVCDPSIDSLDLSKARFQESYLGANIKISIHQNFDLPNVAFDIVIIATNSAIRFSVFQELVKRFTIRNIIFEKFLFQKNGDFDKVESMLEANNIKAWVNCPRRTYSLYSVLKEKLEGTKKISFEVSGTNWGLGCNAIHFLDLYCFLTNSTEISISGEYIDEKILKSKRNNYIEFSGVLFGTIGNSNTFIINSSLVDGLPIQITISTEQQLIIVNERGVNSEIITINRESNSATIENIKLPFQSELTHQIVEEIITKGKSSIATYQDSKIIHQALLNIFINHLQKQSDIKIDSCPIT